MRKAILPSSLFFLLVALPSGCLSSKYVRERARKANQAVREARGALRECLETNRRGGAAASEPPRGATDCSANCPACRASCKEAELKLQEVSGLCDELEHRAH